MFFESVSNEEFGKI